jgi:hypothetical protein
MKIILMLAFVAVATLLGIACHAYREDRPARFNPTLGRFVSCFLIAIHRLIVVWICFGLWAVFLTRSPSAWVLVLGLAGLMFGCFFGLPIFLLELLASRPKPQAAPPARLQRAALGRRVGSLM